MSHEHHISRKELKTDEIRNTLVHGAETALSHQKQLWQIAGAVLALAVLFFGWRFYSDRQNVKAVAAFDEANKVFQARIRLAGEQVPPGDTEPTYVDEKNKFDDAAKKFTLVAQQYPRTRPGRLAKYYTGLSHERLGKFDEAQNWFAQAAAAGDPELAALARFRQAQVYEKTGKGDEAVKLYQQMIAAPAIMLPKAVAMLALADYYRKTNPAEASKLYAQIRTEFASSEIARTAQERLEGMGGS